MSLSQSLEDYLETIMLLDREQDAVRVKDVAENMGVKKPSVVSAVRSLEEKGYLVHEHYGFIKLTSKGLEIAEDVYRNHQLLYTFFSTVLGVDDEIADKDACMIEHYISDHTRDRLIKFIEFVNRYPSEGEDAQWLVNLRHYMETGDVLGCRYMGTKDEE